MSAVGLSAASYRPNPLRRRLAAVQRALRETTLTAAIARLGQDRHCLNKALSALLIGHTGPFRDTEVFEALRSSVLPTMARRCRGPLRVWSLGCSTGDELLSVVALLAELGKCEVVLRGSDCRADAIKQARRRTNDFLHSMPSVIADRRSPGLESRFHRLTEGIEWCAEDVLSCPMSDSWDLVLCRNLSIYLEPPVSKQLWNRIEGCLARGGFLVTGKAERPDGCRSFRRVAKCIYQAEEG